MDFAMLDQDGWFRLLEYLLWVVCKVYVAAVVLALALVILVFTGQVQQRRGQRSRAA